MNWYSLRLGIPCELEGSRLASFVRNVEKRHWWNRCACIYTLCKLHDTKNIARKTTPSQTRRKYLVSQLERNTVLYNRRVLLNTPLIRMSLNFYIKKENIKCITLSILSSSVPKYLQDRYLPMWYNFICHDVHTKIITESVWLCT